MSQLSVLFRKSLFCLLVFLILFAPYSTFVLQAVRHGLGVAGHPLGTLAIQATVGWKELLLVAGALLFAGIWATGRRFPFVITRLDMVIAAFVAFGVVLGVLAGKPSRLVYGFRYDHSVFAYYFLARSVPVSRDVLLGIFRKVVLSSIPILLFAAAQLTILPRNFLERFGYSNDPRVTGNPLPPFHLVAGHMRAMATFPGPNSLAMYVASVLALICSLGDRWFKRGAALCLGVASFLILVFTYSRGHLLSLVLAGLLIGGYSLLRRQVPGLSAPARGYALGAACVVLLALSTAGTVYLGSIKGGEDETGTKGLLFHQTSSVIHRDVRVQAWEGIRKHPFGQGLGTAGLATTNTGEAIFNPESWFIQITYELGWLGLALAVAVIVLICQAFSSLDEDLNDSTDRRILAYFALSFLALVFSANFLPSWFEVGSIMWWVLFGFFLSDYVASFPRVASRFPSQASE